MNFHLKCIIILFEYFHQHLTEFMNCVVVSVYRTCMEFYGGINYIVSIRFARVSLTREMLFLYTI